MPRAPSYNPNQIRPAQTTDARFRAADFTAATDAIAKGGNQLARAGQQYVADEDARQEHYADTFARKLDVDYQREAKPLLSGYLATEGENALREGPTTQAQIKALRDKYLDMASNPRMKAKLAERLAAREIDEYDVMSRHSIAQQKVFDISTATSEFGLAANDAASDFMDPERQKLALSTMDASLDRLRKLNGWDQATYALKREEAISGVHHSVVAGILAKENPDVEFAAAYRAAHYDEMTAGDRVKVDNMLSKPLELRDAAAGYAEAVASIGGFAPSPGAPVDSGSFVSKVRGAESGGKDGAKNPRSSATGRYQFTDSTWLSQYKQRYGSQGLSDAEILAKRRDGKLQDVLMGDLTAQNTQALKGAGINPTHGNLYLAHFAGSGGAIALHKAGPGATAEGVLGSRVIKANPFLRGKTAAQVIEWAAGKMGGPVDTTGRVDKSAVYAAIEARQDWSFEKRERVKEYADRDIARIDEMVSRKERAADAAALEVITKLGENFKSTNQIPRAVWDPLSPADKAKYGKTADDNASGKAVEADGPASTQLKLMSILEPDKFKQTNLGAYVGKMTPAELQGLAVDQAKMLKPSNNAGKPFDPSGGIREAINYGEGFKGVKLAPLLKVKVATYMASVLRDIHEKRPLTGADYDAAFNSAVRQTGSHGWIKADVLTDIPGSFRDKVMRNWKGQRPPTEDEIVTLYRRSLGG